jgi:hypothetical protein
MFTIAELCLYAWPQITSQNPRAGNSSRKPQIVGGKRLSCLFLYVSITATITLSLVPSMSLSDLVGSRRGDDGINANQAHPCLYPLNRDT